MGATRKNIKEKLATMFVTFFILAGISLIAAGLIFWVSGFHRQIWIWVDPSFSDVDQTNIGFADKIIKPGDTVEFCFKPFSSIGGYWEASNVTFFPVAGKRSLFGIWEGMDTVCSREFHKDDPEQLMWVRARFQIPNDPDLEGKTVEGTLQMEIKYPTVTD